VAEFISYFDGVEGEFCLRANRLSRTVWVRRFFAVISKLGDGGFWAIMALALLWKQGWPALQIIVQMTMTAAVGVIIYKLLKKYLVRERPYMIHGGIRCGTAPLDRYSFPSGHTLHAVCSATLFFAFDPLLSIVAIIFAMLVAASRVILGLHYPSDVVVGAVLGLSLATTSLAIVAPA
jgi:undecaprenyl-diphosphatase